MSGTQHSAQSSIYVKKHFLSASQPTLLAFLEVREPAPHIHSGAVSPRWHANTAGGPSQEVRGGQVDVHPEAVGAMMQEEGGTPLRFSATCSK